MRDAADPWTVPSSQALLGLVWHGDPDVAGALLQLLPPLVASRSEAKQYLTSSAALKRLLGLVRTHTELSYAVDPKLASVLSIALQPVVTTELFAALGVDGRFALKARLGFLAACSRAALQTGDFSSALQIADQAFEISALDAAGEALGWCDDVRYEALIRTFRFEEAWRVRRERKTGTLALSNRSHELDQLLDVFAPQPIEDVVVEPERGFSWLQATKTLTTEWLRDQQEANDKLRHSFLGLPLPPQDRVILDGYFADAEHSLRSIERAVILAEAPDVDRDDILHRELYRLQTSLRLLQGSPRDRATTLDDNRHRLNRAAMIVGLIQPTADELQEAYLAATAAARWSAETADQHGELMALWTLGLVQDRRGDAQGALHAFEAVFDRLVLLRSRILTSSQARSLLAGTFRTLIPRLADLAARLEKHELAFEALEFRRGIAIVENDLRHRNSERVEVPAGVHYLAVSVFAEHGTFTALRCADGCHQVRRIALGWDRINTLVLNIDPESWLPRLFRPAQSPRQELTALVELLDEAFTTGRIRRDDHIAVALDHPLHAVPIHYLGVGGAALAVELLSFSRVASYDDVRRIAAMTPAACNKAGVIFVPPGDADDMAADTKAFGRSIEPLQSRLHTRLEGIDADRDAVRDALLSNDVIHFHAHGWFREARPETTVDAVRESGLLIASDGYLPRRSSPEHSLLSPQSLLEGPEIAAKHVSLAACVSGLGRPGRGGDMLGLEFAFRLRGAESVIASHWHVQTGLAAEFYADYYRLWLVDGKSRAAAWRDATLRMIKAGPSGTTVEACAKCAFSLFGDWR